MTAYLSEAEARATFSPEALNALGLLAPAPTPLYAAVVTEASTPPEAPTTPQITSLAATQAYKLLRAALALSEARYGVPVVVRVRGGYGIRCAPLLAVGVDITEPLVTVVSQHVYAASKWRRLETLRLPKLTPHELLSLFVTGKE